MSNIILENCKTITDDIVNIIIENEKITKITKTLKSSEKTTDEIIDIKNNIVIPGLIDSHVHFRDPGLTHKEDWKTGSMAAAHGGYTTVVDMPNTSPLTDNLKNFREKKEIALKKSYVDFGLQAGVKSKKDVDEILQEKPTAYKIFMDLHENDQLDEMFSYIEGTDKTLCLHCEDKNLVDYNTRVLKSNPEYDNKTKAYSYARSALAELISLNRAIELACKYNLKLHICHVSTRQALELIRAARDKIEITIEATPHHIFLDNSIYDTYGVKAKTNPPLRDNKYNISVDKLGEFDSIATDHAPHTLDEKMKDTWSSAAGIPGLEVTMKLLLTEVNNNRLTLNDVVRLTSHNPARIFNIENKGQIKEGFDADITVVDMKARGKIDVDTFYTRGKYTPFEQREYIGSNIMTINRGCVISENDEVIKQDCKYIH